MSRLIDADELMELLTTAIRNMEVVAKFLNAEDDPEIQMGIKAYKNIANCVKDMPTIESEPQWIPCSERLPVEDGEYLITVKYEHVDGHEDIYSEHGDWDDGKWDMFSFGHCGKVESIIAWMPLPEPYREEGD